MIHTITKEAFTIMKTFLCYIFSYLIEAFIIWQYASHLFQRKSKKWITCSVLIILYGILFFFSTLDLFWLNAISFFTINFIFIFLFFERNIPSCAFHAGISSHYDGIGRTDCRRYVFRFFKSLLYCPFRHDLFISLRHFNQVDLWRIHVSAFTPFITL